MSYSHPVEPGIGVSLNPLLVVMALAAGLVSFASPCVLPLVPAYLDFITGGLTLITSALTKVFGNGLAL